MNVDDMSPHSWSTSTKPPPPPPPSSSSEKLAPRVKKGISNGYLRTQLENSPFPSKGILRKGQHLDLTGLEDGIDGTRPKHQEPQNDHHNAEGKA